VRSGIQIIVLGVVSSFAFGETAIAESIDCAYALASISKISGFETGDKWTNETRVANPSLSQHFFQKQVLDDFGLEGELWDVQEVGSASEPSQYPSGTFLKLMGSQQSKELDAFISAARVEGIPIYMSPYWIDGLNAFAHSNQPFHKEAKSYVVIPPQKPSLITLNHELQHARDMATRVADFNKRLTQYSGDLMHLIETSKSRESLQPKEEKKLDTAFRALQAELEVTATQKAIVSALNLNTWADTIKDPAQMAREIYSLLNNLCLTIVDSAKLTYFSIRLNPLAPRTLYLTVKTTGMLAVTFTIVAGALVSTAFYFLTGP